MLQRALGLLGLGPSGEVREEHLGVRQVGRHLDAGDRDPADPRILDLVAQDLRELALDLVADPVRPLRMAFHQPSYSVRETSTIS